MNKLSQSAERLAVPPSKTASVAQKALLAILLTPVGSIAGVVCCARQGLQETVQPQKVNEHKEPAKEVNSWYEDCEDCTARDSEITTMIGENLRDIMKLEQKDFALNQVFSKIVTYKGVKFHCEFSFQLDDTDFQVNFRAYGPPAKKQYQFIMPTVKFPRNKDETQKI